MPSMSIVSLENPDLFGMMGVASPSRLAQFHGERLSLLAADFASLLKSRVSMQAGISPFDIRSASFSAPLKGVRNWLPQTAYSWLGCAGSGATGVTIGQRKSQIPPHSNRKECQTNPHNAHFP